MILSRLVALIIIGQCFSVGVHAQYEHQPTLRIPVSLGISAYGLMRNFRDPWESEGEVSYVADYIAFDARPAELTVLDDTRVRLSFDKALRLEIYHATTQKFIHDQLLKSVVMRMHPDQVREILSVEVGQLSPRKPIDYEWLETFNSLTEPSHFDRYVVDFGQRDEVRWIEAKSLALTIEYQGIGRSEGALVDHEIYLEGRGLNSRFRPTVPPLEVSIPLSDEPMLLSPKSPLIEGFKKSMEKLLRREQEIAKRGWTLGLLEEASSPETVAKAIAESDKVVSLVQMRSCQGVFKGKD